MAKLPKQAAILSSTAIEKCFKAVLAFNGNESHGHLKTAHWNAVKNFDKNIYKSLNLDFLNLNKNVYKLRYTDDLPIDYNLVIASREFLAELDQTILYIIRSFKFGDPNENAHLSKLEHLISSRDERVCNENHVISGESKEVFIYRASQFIYEIRKHDQTLFEVTYEAMGMPKDERFTRAAFKPVASNKFDLSFGKQEQD